MPAVYHGGGAGDLRARLEQWLVKAGDGASVDEAGHLRLDASVRGWTPSPPLRTQLGLRPY